MLAHAPVEEGVCNSLDLVRSVSVTSALRLCAFRVIFSAIFGRVLTITT